MTRFLPPIVAATALLAVGLSALAGPLHDAVESGDIDQVKQAIAEGADVNQGDFALGTPLFLAANKGQAAIAALLIEEGADVSFEDILIGFTPLHAAAFAGHVDVVEVLIAHGADVNGAGIATGKTPLHTAAEGGHLPIVDLLIAKGVDVNERDNDHTAPIHYAAASAHFDVVELLIAHGASTPPVEPASGLLTTADPNKGKLLYVSCRGCHVIERDRPHRIGPNLWSVVGRKKTSAEGFDYSPAFARLVGTWTYEELNAFIASPRDFVPGTKMAFPGMKDVTKRAHLIAYLRQNSDNPPPLPAQ